MPSQAISTDALREHMAHGGIRASPERRATSHKVAGPHAEVTRIIRLHSRTWIPEGHAEPAFGTVGAQGEGRPARAQRAEGAQCSAHVHELLHQPAPGGRPGAAARLFLPRSLIFAGS